MKPRRLEWGDTIGIISPASPMRLDRLQRGVEYLQQKGYHVLVGKNAYQKRGYLAGTDSQRASDLNDMLLNPQVKAIFCTRGGYGTLRILDLIDYSIIRKNPKILVGYSDITALQLAIFSQTGLITFSGPMVAVEMGKGLDSFTEKNFWKVLSSPERIGPLEDPNSRGLVVFREGKARGILIGGCLSILTSLLGTKYLPDLEDKILFLEEVGEEPYRFDRYLTQLKLAGILNQVQGIIFGQIVDCVPKEEQSLTIEEVIEEVTADLDIPVVSGVPYGHIDRKFTLPIGVEAFLDTKRQRIEILEGAVS